MGAITGGRIVRVKHYRCGTLIKAKRVAQELSAREIVRGGVSEPVDLGDAPEAAGPCGTLARSEPAPSLSWSLLHLWPALVMYYESHRNRAGLIGARTGPRGREEPAES